MTSRKFKSEIDMFTTFSSDTYESERYRKSIKGTVYVHQNNSDLAAGLEMSGYKVIVAQKGNIIQNTIHIAKEGRRSGIDLYIIDSIAVDNGELQAPFSLIGYIRVYDPYTPILALSYDTTPESVQSAFRYGTTAYLPRPQKLDLIAAVANGLISAHTIATEAVEMMESEIKSKTASCGEHVEMVKISDSLFLDYGGKRLAFLDTDGVFTFSNILSDGVVQMIHCLAVNKNKRLSAVAIGRLLGEIYAGMDSQDERKASYKLSANLATVKNILKKYDKYKTVTLSTIRRYGTTLEVHEPDKEAVDRYKLEKANAKKSKGVVKAGFGLVSLMEKNSEVRQDADVKLEDLL